jgi:hypothetical protein
LNQSVAEFRITYRPNRRTSFHGRWHPLLHDITAERAVVSASSVYGQPGLHRFDASLYQRVRGRLGRAAGWTFAGIAVSIHIDGVGVAREEGYGDHIALLHPSAAPIWECRWCQVKNADLVAAAGCAARGWDAKCAAWAESERRYFEANRDAWWAQRR